MHDLDLDAYFDRIGHGGATLPTMATLEALLTAHTARIPFENLDALLHHPVRLDLPGLQEKLVQARRGGYCFEHATLFAAVLEALGFDIRRHSGRVIVFATPDQASRGHMFLTVKLDGRRWVVDPGFGLFGSRSPLPLDGTPVGTHRMSGLGRDWTLHANRDGTEFPAWLSTLDAENTIDFEMASHFVNTHPASHFTQRLLASALTPNGRVNVMNRSVNRISGATVESSDLPDRRALRALLATDFGFDLAEVETMHIPSDPDWR